MSYKAVHKKTGKEYEVIGKDTVGTLLSLKEIGTGIKVTSNRGYYDIYNDNGDFIDEDGVIHSTSDEDEEDEDEVIENPTTEQICSAYKDFIDSPYSDGYTVVYLESKFGMSIEDMEKIYKKNRTKSYNLTSEELLKKISSLVHTQSILSNGKIINDITELLEDNGYTE